MASSIELILGNLIAAQGVVAQAVLGADDTGILSTILAVSSRWAQVIIGIGLVIFVHELGHFLAAKWCGVKVEKFYVGFDFPIRIGPIQLPRTLGRFRYGETEYGIGTIPLGGYVKMLGQDDDPRQMEEEAQRIRQRSDEEDADGPQSAPEVRAQLDPRSFPAKPVWQRMIIISAGVVMNVISGVLFAAAAFYYGVPYTPAVVGEVTPSGPAYAAGIEPGGKVISVGRIQHDDQLYFSDMRAAIFLASSDSDEFAVDVAVEYPDGIRQYTLETVPSEFVPELRQVGVVNLRTTFLVSRAPAAIPGSVAHQALTPEDAGAEVIAIDDEPIPGAGQRDNVEGTLLLHRRLQADVDAPIKLTLRRQDGSTIERVVSPQPLQTPGIGLKPGRVVGVVAGGPAAEAGLQRGDQILAIDGDQQLDAIRLPGRLAKSAAPVQLQVRRGDGDQAETLQLELTPQSSRRTAKPIRDLDNTVELDTLGFAVRLTPEVVLLDGEADQGPLRRGDLLKKVTAAWPESELPARLAGDDAPTKHARKLLAAGVEFSATFPVASLVELWQTLPEGTRLQLTVERDGKLVELEVALQRSEDDHWYDRGLLFADLQRTHVASGLIPALQLGYVASKRKLGEIFQILRLLVSLKASPKVLGGPITIFRVADEETKRGPATLLLFLTLLSMNLAILNFLPIPALDGGHMVFLTAEAILGKPVNEKVQMQLTMAGVLALLSLMAFALFNDFRRLM